MATYLQLCNKVLERNDLNTVSGVTDTSQPLLTQVKNFINDVIIDIINASLDWSWREATGTLSVLAGTITYSLPSTVDIDGIKSFKYSDTFQPLNYLSYNEFDQDLFAYNYDLYLNTTQQTLARANIFTIVGNQIILYPTPTANATLVYRYQQIPSELAIDADTPIIPVKYQNIIVYGASAMLRNFLGNNAGSIADTTLFSDGLQRMLGHNRKYINSHPTMKLRPHRWFR